MSKFLKFLVNLFLICSILITGSLLIPPLAGVTTNIIDTVNMDTNLSFGSVTYSNATSVAELAEGDKVLVDSGSSLYVYRIQSGDASTGEFTVLNAMDKSSEASRVQLRNPIYKVILTVPYIGYVVVAMQSAEGFIIIVLILVFVAILFILSELWRRNDDDDDEEEEEDHTETRRERKARLKAEKEARKQRKKEKAQAEEVSPAADPRGKGGRSAKAPSGESPAPKTKPEPLAYKGQEGGPGPAEGAALPGRETKSALTSASGNQEAAAPEAGISGSVAKETGEEAEEAGPLGGQIRDIRLETEGVIPADDIGGQTRDIRLEGSGFGAGGDLNGKTRDIRFDRGSEDLAGEPGSKTREIRFDRDSVDLTGEPGGKTRDIRFDRGSVDLAGEPGGKTRDIRLEGRQAERYADILGDRLMEQGVPKEALPFGGSPEDQPREETIPEGAGSLDSWLYAPDITLGSVADTPVSTPSGAGKAAHGVSGLSAVLYGQAADGAGKVPDVGSSPEYISPLAASYGQTAVPRKAEEAPAFGGRDSGNASAYPLSEEIETEREDLDHFVPVERPTLEEIVEQAKKRGHNPEIRRDSITNVNLVDFSDYL